MVFSISWDSLGHPALPPDASPEGRVSPTSSFLFACALQFLEYFGASQMMPDGDSHVQATGLSPKSLLQCVESLSELLRMNILRALSVFESQLFCSSV